MPARLPAMFRRSAIGLDRHVTVSHGDMPGGITRKRM